MLENLINNSKDIFLTCNYSGKIINVNPAFEKILNYKPIEYLKGQIFNFIKKNEVSIFKEYFKELLAGKKDEEIILSHFISKSKAEIPIEWSFTIDREKKLFCGVGRNISNRVLTGFEKERYFNNYAGIYDAMSEGLVIHNSEGKAIEFNNSALKILGVSSDQLLGNSSLDPRWNAKAEDGSTIRGEDHPAMKTLRENKSYRNVIMQLERPEDGSVWIKINSEPIYYGKDRSKPNSVVVTFTDITVEYNFKSRLNKINHSLDFLSGTKYLNELTSCLGKVLKPEHCFIGKYSNNFDQVETLSYWNEELKENFNYDLDNTPCKNVSTGKICIFNGNVQLVYPNDKILKDWNIVSYIGVPLKDKNAKPLGILALLFRSKINDIEQISRIVKLYSSRSAVEIERLEYEKELENRQKFIETLFDTIPYPIFAKDSKLKYINCNKAFEDYFDTSIEKIRGKSVFEVYPSYLAYQYNEKDKDLLDSKNGNQTYEWFIKKNDDIRNVSFNKSIFYDENNQVGGIVGILEDITERKTAKKKLEESERLFRNVFNSAPISIAITDREGANIKVNPALVDYLGYSEKELLGKKFIEFTHPDDHKKEEQLMPRILKGDGLINYDKRYITKSGETVWGNFTLTTLRDDANNIIGFVGMVLDITKRKEFELKVLESEKKYRSLFENANDGIAIMKDYRIIDCNKRTIDIFGYYDINEIKNLEPSQVSPEYQENGKNSQEASRKLMDRALKGESIIFNWLHLKKNGKVIQCEISISSITYQGENCVLAIIRDETEKKEFAKELNYKNKELQNFYDVIDNSLIMSYSNPQGKVLDVNEKYEDISGYDYEEIVGFNYRVVNSDYHTKEFWQNMWNTIREGKIWKGEIRNKKKNGDHYWLSTTIYPIIGKEGNINYYLEISQDITLEKNYQIELEKKVDERTNELQVLNNEKDFLLSMMSHDLKNPLTAIYMQLSLVESIANKKKDKQIIEKAQSTMKIAKDMDQLIKNILELNEVDSKIEIQNKKDIELGDFLDDIFIAFDPIAKSKKQELLFVNELEEKAVIRTDKGYFKQIMDNLVSNALKYTEEGKEIMIRSSQKSENYLVEIKDKGIGIKESEIKKIFVKFSKLINKPTSGESSTGLGLSIVKRLCELLEFKIEVESEYGKGSNFKVIIPKNH